MASTIGFSGIGSGIDFTAIRDAIIAQRSQPITQMQTKVVNLNTRVDALKQLNGLLANLTAATKSLTDRTVGTGRSATLTDPTVATVTAASGATAGNINLTVTRLASNLTQTSRSYTAVDAPVLAGGDTTATFEFNKGGADTGISVTIDSSNNTLAGLRDAINSKNAGVTATIIDVNGDGTGQQLVLSSTETGAAGRVELVNTSGTATAADLGLNSLNPPDGDLTKLDAAFTLNGLNLTRSSNDVSNAITGLNIKLTKAGSTIIAVSQSSEVDDKLASVVTAYNAVQDFIAGQYKKDSQGRPTGILAGDTALRNVQQQVSQITNIESLDNGGPLSSLTQLGISIGRDGHMALDKVALDAQLQANPADVASLLFGKTATDAGIFQSAFGLANSLSDNITGSVQNAINGYQSSVKSLNSTIDDRTAIINSMSASLTRQFAAADAAINQLNGQSTSLTSIIKSLTNSNN
ncbi:MAG: flagellar filament capping protein FliD [Acidobacteriota bacterium]